MPVQGLTASPQEVLQASLDSLFEPDGDVTDKEDLDDRIAAVENLAGLFVAQNSDYGFEDLQFEWLGLRLMVGRFHRDAFGVRGVESWINAQIAGQRVSAAVAASMLQRVQDIGVRINSAQPMRTRVAAAFSLWMTVCRPVSLHGSAALHDPAAPKFCAALNFWIASQYLRKYGQIRIGTQDDADKRLARIHYDFTCRALNLSSLEMLYCSIFRPVSKAAAVVA